MGVDNFDLGALADPTKSHDSIKIDGEDPVFLKSQFRQMLTIRLVEEHLAAMRKEGVIGGPVHLGAGQEAVAVGVSTSLRNTDRIFGAHRSHSHVLAMGGSIHGLFAEVLGRETGLSRGMGGSMHLWDQPRGFYGSVPIVAGTVALATGAGLAAKMSGTDDIGVVYFGDGAIEEGVVHESLNLARMLQVPVLFVIENNLFSSHMHISLRQPHDATSRFAAAHDIRFDTVDGNNVVAVKNAAQRLINHSRSGEGPGFLEAVTYRLYGHVDWREDIDVGVRRSTEDLANWRKRDPIKRLFQGMEEAGIFSLDEQNLCEAEIRKDIDEAWAQALRDPYPSPDTLLDRVYTKQVMG